MTPRHVGILFESRSDVLAKGEAEHPAAYHWREPAEVDAVAAALDGLGLDVELIGPLEALLARDIAAPLDLVMNLSVRTESRNRTALAPALLETMGIAYVGADATAKALALNKDLLKPYLVHLGLATPHWTIVSRPGEFQARPPWSRFVVKPAAEGNSLGVNVFDDDAPTSEVSAVVDRLLATFGVPVIIEELIVGREICVAVVGEEAEAVWGASEVFTPGGEPMGPAVLDNRAKRAADHLRQDLSLDRPDTTEATSIATRILRSVGPVDYASFDFRVGADGAPILIDVNLDATLHPERSLARSITGRGMSYGDMIGRVVSRFVRP